MQAELYAIKYTKQDGSFWYSHFYYHKELLDMCFSGSKIVKVRLTELDQIEDGCYYSWKKLLDNGIFEEKLMDPPEFHFTGAAECLVEMCFAYGSKAEEARGRGKLVPVKLEIIENE